MSHGPSNFPRRVTPYFESLAENPGDPIAMQFDPTAAEKNVLDYELTDPLGERTQSPLPRIVHRYDDRILLLVTDSCAIHCRYCFRRHFTGGGGGVITSPEMAKVTGYLLDHPQVTEVLLSGGDPLTLSDNEIERVVSSLRDVRDDLVLRLCTRVPGVLPSRISDNLCRILAEQQPVWAIVQINHPRELTDETTRAFERMVSGGIPVVSQTVLLRGVNDDPDTLAELFRGLLARRVKPYYLFQTDLVRGTSHFRVPLRRAQSIVTSLRSKISNLACPEFAVDIPGGGGKIPLHDSAVSGPKDGWFELAGPDGEAGRYPDEGGPLVQS